MDDDGTVYLYYVRFDGGNVIYMAKMNDDLLSLDENNERFLFRADKEWELKDCEVVEGPFVLSITADIFLHIRQIIPEARIML